MNEIKILVFNLNGEYFATDIMEVERILGSIAITKIPNSPSYLEGVAKYEEEVIPVINLYKKFNFEEYTNNENRKIIVVKKELGKFGVAVDDVKEVTTVKQEIIDYSSAMTAVVSRKYIKGIIKEKDKLIVLLDLNNILLEEEGLVFERME